MFISSLQEKRLTQNKECCEGVRYSAPSTLHWHGTDTKDLFTKNLKENRDSVRTYLSTPVLYNINEYGFRTVFDFDNSESIITLGCSHTFGVGNRENEIWPYYLSQNLNLKLYNLGVPGGAMSSCFRVLTSWIDKIRPKLVILFEPHSARREFFNNGEIVGMLPSNRRFAKLREFYDDDEDVNNTSIIRNAIENICNKHNSKFFYFEHGFETVPERGIIDRGRDLQHFGPKSHLAMSRRMQMVITNELERNIY